MRLLKSIFLSLVAMLFASEAFACTTVIVSAGASATGRPLLWKQRDTGNPYNTLAYIRSTDSTYAYTALFNVRDSLHRAAYAGENEKGFVIANNVSYNLAVGDYSPKNGSFMRLALECCADVDEFEALLRTGKYRNVEANFAVIDSSGAAAYFEAADSSITRFDVPEGGWLVRTNFSFSGIPDREGLNDSRYLRAGYARYETAFRLMASHKGKFTPQFLIDGLGRSFYNAVLGYDASKRFASGRAYDEDFIPRPTSTASICFDGNACIWAAVGFTPATYAIPVRACSELPSCLVRANALSVRLKRSMHAFCREAGEKYIDFRLARPIMKTVRRYEKEAASLLSDNDAIDRLFARFEKEFE